MFKGKKEIKDEVLEGKLEIKETVKTYDGSALSVIRIGNEWALVKVSYSLEHDECIKEVLRTELYRDIILEQFKIEVANTFII
jgi:hypothetical protein